MKTSFSDQPGSRERHLRRRYNNPLFGDRAEISDDELEAAREADAKEHEQFYLEFQKILQQIADFSGQEDSERILEAKQKVDQMHEQACGLAGDNQAAIDGLVRLQTMIMQAITQGAQGDSKALQELEDEAAARSLHQQLLTHKLVCDLLRPDTPVGQDELAPTILSSDPDAIRAAMVMFQPETLQVLIESCEALLARLDEQGIDTAEARDRMRLLLNARSANPAFNS